jgi:hypothetical protein
MDQQDNVARRAALRRLLAMGVLGAGGSAAWIRDALAAGHEQGIRSLKGTVTIDGQPASVGQKILPGQKIETGADGKAVYVIGKDAFLQHQDSSLALHSSGSVVVLRYLTGRVLSVFGKGRKTLQTPTATIGIRGTGCYIEATADNTYFCLCYGGAIVEPKAAPGMRKFIRTRHHESPLYVSNSGSMIAPAKVVDHTDAELVMLEQLVGRLPPFYGKKYSAY